MGWFWSATTTTHTPSTATPTYTGSPSTITGSSRGSTSTSTVSSPTNAGTTRCTTMLTTKSYSSGSTVSPQATSTVSPVSGHPNGAAIPSNADTIASLPIAVGVVCSALLIIAVIVIVIMYKRGRFERICGKNQWRDNRQGDNPSFFVSNNGSQGNEGIPDDSNSHLGDIDLPTDQTYNTAILNCKTDVTDPTYNHIQHQINTTSTTDATYNHIGECVMFNINGNQSGAYSHVGRDGNSETGCDLNDTCAHTYQTLNVEKGLSQEGTYSQLTSCVAPYVEQTQLRGTNAENHEMFKDTNDRNYLYACPIDSANRTPNEDPEQKRNGSEAPEHNPFCFLEESAPASDEGAKTHDYFVLQKVDTKI